MATERLEVREYVTPEGRNCYRTWLFSIRDRQTQGIIQGRVGRLEFGIIGDSKAVGDGVFELRIHFGPGYRIYFAWESDRVVLLLTGGSKKSQAMDIKRAQTYWKKFKGER